MKKQKKRTLRPYELWDEKLVEQWLEEEARKGWQLSDCGRWLAVFEAIEPGEYRVRMEPQRPETYQERRERGAAYREMGWNCTAVLSDGQDYEVFYCNDPEVPELHTDPVAYRWAWEKSLRRSARDAWLILMLSLILMLLPVLVGAALHETPLDSFLNMTLLSLYGVLIAAPFYLITAIRKMRNVRKFRRQIKAEVMPESGRDWRKSRRWGNAVAVMTILFWVLYCLGEPAWKYWAEPDRSGLPYVTATELLPGTTQEDWDFEWGEYVNRARPLSPTRYVARYVTEGQRRVGNTSDRLRFTVLAKALYQEKLETFRRDWPGAEETAIENSAFDEAVLLTGGEDVQMLLVRSGKIVYSLWVNFPADLSGCLDEIAADLTDAS